MTRSLDRSAGQLLRAVLPCVLLAAASGTASGQPPADGGQPAKPARNTPDEPLAKTLSLARSAEFLDAVTMTWLRDMKCAACHTGHPYLMARASLGGPAAPALLQVRKFFEDRVVEWDRGGKGAGYIKGEGKLKETEGISEVVAVAATLAVHDAHSTGKLHPRTQQALERMWELQREDGSWAWNKTGLAPFEHDEYYGVVYAAVGVGHAPEPYAEGEGAKEGVARLRRYLRKNPPPDLHHKAWLLWASVKLDGLLDRAGREQAIKDLLAAQRDDGGWCLPSLGGWKRRDGTANDKRAPSDGYATGLVLYVLRQAGVAPTAEPIRRGAAWLKANQRASGRWFTPSLNRDTGHLIANAGTAFAVMALKACDPARGDDPPEPAAVKLDPKALDACVGQYEFFPKFGLTLSRFRNHLLAQITGQPVLVVFPESETRFRYKVVDAAITLERDGDGKVTGLVLEQDGRKLKAKKVSNEVPREEDVPDPEPTFDSPRLAALAKAVKEGDRAALARFWDEVRDKAPLVEPVAGDPKASWVTFVWRGGEGTRRVCLGGGPPTGESRRWLTRLADTDLWYRTERVPNGARFAYWFRVNLPVKEPADAAGHAAELGRFPLRPDPLNPREWVAQSMLGSPAELPGAPPQPWVERLPGVAKGALKRHTIKSEILKQDRGVTVYTPAGYDPGGEPCGLVVLFDGPLYQDDGIPGPAILDNLIAKEKVRPLVAVFVRHDQHRNRDLACSEPFADFVAKELVPWVRANYRVGPDPARTIVGGLSLGGLMSAFCGLRHPDVFGNVLSQSGSYQWFPGMLEGKPASAAEPGWLTREYVEAPRRPVRFYLEAGRFEDDFGASLLAENRRFRDVLKAKGYSVRYSEFVGGHDFLGWRGSLADGLIELAGRPRRE